MTTEQFRNNPELVEGAKKVLADPILALMLSIRDDEAPLHDLPDDTSDTSALVAYGVEKGYARYSRELRFMATRATVRQTLEPDYGTYKPKPTVTSKTM